MENKEPKFIPEFSFLEDPKILELDNLVNATFSVFTKEEDKPKALEELKEKWKRVQKDLIEKNDINDVDVQNFLRFVRYNIRKMDAGGMNVGRSRISNFIDEQAVELRAHYDRLGVAELDAEDTNNNSQSKLDRFFNLD